MAITVDTYTGHDWVDNSSPDLEAEILNEIEVGIRNNNTAIKAVLAALTSQISNDTDKFASIAAVYALSQSLNTLSTTVANLNSNLALKANTSDLSAKFVDLIGLQKINTSAVTSDSFGNVVVSNAMGSVSVTLLSCTRYISGADYALTVEDITTTAITIRARKIIDGTVPPTGSSYGSLVFAKL